MTLLSDSAEGVGYLLKDRISDVNDFLGAVRRVAGAGRRWTRHRLDAAARRRSDDPSAS